MIHLFHWKYQGISKFFPYFEEALRAMDGTHITCCLSAAERQL
jgi:hypothetical protein